MGVWPLFSENIIKELQFQLKDSVCRQGNGTIKGSETDTAKCHAKTCEHCDEPFSPSRVVIHIATEKRQPCLRAMVGLHELNEVLLLKVLDLSFDASVLELAAASHALRNAVDNCRRVSSEGPWQHMPGAWEASGLWRYLGLGDLEMIPAVTLRCEAKFQKTAEVLAFFKAAKAFAVDTVNGHVTFNMLVFPDVAALFAGEAQGFFFTSNKTKIIFDGYQIECLLDVHFDLPDDEVPWINLYAWHIDDNGMFLDRQDMPQNTPMICCSSLLLPGLRLYIGFDVYYEHHLGADSPLTDLVRANLPLPMFFGVTGFDASGDR